MIQTLNAFALVVGWLHIAFYVGMVLLVACLILHASVIRPWMLRRAEKRRNAEILAALSETAHWPQSAPDAPNPPTRPKAT